MIVEEVLHLFIGDVDEKLLRRVGLEVFKSENVQNPNLEHLLTDKCRKKKMF